MNNEELYKRILNKVCIHFGYDVAHDLEYLFLVKEQEIERLNNIIDKKEQFLGDNIKRLEREVVKRDNIINELEKWLEEYISLLEAGDICDETKQDTLKEVLDKLKELKGEDNNENNRFIK